MRFLNIRAILIAAGIGVGSGLGLHVADSESTGFQFGFAPFLISAIILHIKPELLGKLNKTDDDGET